MRGRMNGKEAGQELNEPRRSGGTGRSDQILFPPWLGLRRSGRALAASSHGSMILYYIVLGVKSIYSGGWTALIPLKLNFMQVNIARRELK